MNGWKLDFKRAFCSKLFLITILLFPLCDMLGLALEDMGGVSVIDLLNYAMLAGFSIAVYAFYAIPYSHSYCSDLENHFIRYHVVRSTLKKYVASKVLFCALSSGSAAVLGRAVTVCLLSARYPLYDETGGTLEYLLPGRMASEGKAVSVLVTMLILLFLQAAFFGVMAFTVSAFLQNPFIVAASPVILHRLYTDVFAWFPDVYNILSLNRIYVLSFSECSTLWGAVLYALVFTAVGAALMGRLSYGRIRRRFENE